MQNMVILGATGSIGASTLSVISANPTAYRVYALVANASVDKMLALCLAHRPQVAHMVDHKAALALKAQLPAALNIQVTSGEDELIALVTAPAVDTVMAAIVGAAGLVPTLAAVKAGKRVLLANKEALVMSGELFIEATKASGATLLPVDSEHNAIFQCLPEEVQSNLGRCDLAASGISHILLTGSGGPFLTTELSNLAAMTPAQACKHPNWSMGPKISVDSATMMNKGLEFIEARWLFNTQKDQLKVVIHPQSVIHSMVQYRDGSVIAQMGNPDMRTPIAHCMSYLNRFPCLALAIEACSQGQEATTVLNAANEIAVEAFLQGQIGFTHIAKVNEACLSSVPKRAMASIDDIIALDAQARIYAREQLAKFA